MKYRHSKGVWLDGMRRAGDYVGYRVMLNGKPGDIISGDKDGEVCFVLDSVVAARKGLGFEKHPISSDTEVNVFDHTQWAY